MITSRSNAQVKNIRKLLDSAKERKEQGLFVVEGERIVREVPKDLLVKVYVSESYMQNAYESRILNIPEDKTEILSDDVFKHASDTATPQGIMAVVKMPVYGPENDYTLKTSDKTGAQHKKYVILDDIRDPGNLGTIIRTSEAAGAEAVILSPGCADIFNPKVIRSTMGSIFRVRFYICSLVPVILKLKADGVRVYGTSLKASRPYNEVQYTDKTAFIIGNEANGVSRKVLECTDMNINIPMQGQVESLNAAISCAILLFSC